ncbi:MAG: methyltransferase domain-containing protein [Deltaproteobacteria bacterium]|nr:methyltransferase domain-containing protein [Deltaproteobacteria bacterium]
MAFLHDFGLKIMQAAFLKFLACPNPSCRGTLKLDAAGSLKSSDKKSREIAEGFVACQTCREIYPILKGIVILVPDVWNYLSRNFLLIKGICAKYGGLAPQTLKTIMSRISLPLPKQVDYDVSRQRVFERESSFYRLSHYGDLWKGLSPKEPLFDFLQQQKGRSPHDVLETFLLNGTRKNGGIAVEVGCNVGGFLKRIAPRYETLFGVDLNLEVLILAKKLLKGGPVELLLAQGEYLPFADQTLDLAASVNVIDLLEKPEEFLKEQTRPLKKGGKLLLAAPYVFAQNLNGRAKNPIQWVKNMLKGKILLEKEKDPVCWIYRKGPRQYEIFYTHCLSAVKRG